MLWRAVLKNLRCYGWKKKSLTFLLVHDFEGQILYTENFTGNPGLQIDQSQLDAQDPNQEVVFYEVAVGTDRRFPKTRDDVVPFTNVGLNKTIIFYDLELTAITGIYYFTVKAYSASYSVATVTSNGFRVGFNGGVTGMCSQ